MNKESRWQRARRDTKISLWKEVVAFISTALILKYFLSTQQFEQQLLKMAAAGVSGAIIWPICLLCFNYIRAPIRIARDTIKILQSQLNEYKARAR